jgi:serine/threonine-protein kinase
MVGEKLGSFRIEDTIGIGAMGVVYRAIHEPSGRTVAIKVVNKDIASRGKTYDRFQREAEILQQFRQPNIVRFLALGRYQGTWYMAMEFVRGKTLENWLGEHGPVPWREVVELGIQICDALQYAHDHGVVHRDLKPSNLMITEDGKVKLTDFGIAKDLDATALTATGRTLGTAAYMAPEQIRGTPEISHKTDLYALGIVFYQMLTGRLPFEGSSAVVLMHGHLNEPAPRPSSKVTEIPKELDTLVFQLMAKNPSDRPWDAAAVGLVLNKIRERASRGETVPMVWPTNSVDDSGASRATNGAKKTKKKSRVRGGGTSSSAKAFAAEQESRSRNRAMLETAALVLALAAIGGFIGYIVWPPSAKYLYDQAERLMVSENRHDWSTAIDEYVEPLDRRFPENAYKKTTRGWRDKVLLADAEGRARTLESPVNTKLNLPKSEEEESFLAYSTAAVAAWKRGDAIESQSVWQRMAKEFPADDPKVRSWHLLAQKRADDVKDAIAKRREVVLKLLYEVDDHAAKGELQKARALRDEVLERYGQYTDLSDLLGPLTPPSTPKSDSAPAARPTAAAADAPHPAGAKEPTPAERAADGKSDSPSRPSSPR